MSQTKKTSTGKEIAKNKKAYFNYEVLEEFTAGIKLLGSEIKSLRTAKPSFAGSYVTIAGHIPSLVDLNIPRYKYDSSEDYHPKRKRLLLLKKREIEAINRKCNEKTVTLVPTRIFLSHGLAKITIALVRGKKKHDKRQTIKDRESDRKAKRAMKQY
jgi:SsrA-binding protein